MVDTKDTPIPKSIIRTLSTVLMIMGILLYIGWIITASIINGKIILFDLGLYSITIIMFLMGLTGRYLYGLKMAKGSYQD